jgi:ABC-type polysaccharide/polyol phosphate export permease
MFKELAEVYRYRELLMSMVARDMKVRYKNSVLGFIWSLLIPLAQVATLTIVFKYIMGVTVKNYSALLLCAIIPFTFFQQSVLESTTSILANFQIVKKTYFPREILPASVVISNLIHFALAMVVFFLYIIVLRLVSGDGQPPILITWLLVPVVMAILFLFSMGISLIVACLNTYYEDVKYLTTIIMNLVFYTVPVLYLMELPMQREYHHSLVGTLLKIHFSYNPLCYLMTAFRKILLPPFGGEMFKIHLHDIPLNYGLLAWSAFVSIVVFIIGYRFFNARKWKFAELL